MTTTLFAAAGAELAGGTELTGGVVLVEGADEPDDDMVPHAVAATSNTPTVAVSLMRTAQSCTRAHWRAVKVTRPMTEPQTWHHGLIADWWAEFNTDGPEIDYFGQFVARGQPALDAGCGAGRLLVPWLEAGFDADGSDASADMLERCRTRAAAAGHSPALLHQALHQLDPPRRYRTIVVCGVFGLGSTRAEDEQALQRCNAALEPGGMLLLDNEAPYADARMWARWTGAGRAALPGQFPEEGMRRAAADGSTLELRTRVLSIDPLDQRADMEICAHRLRGGDVVATETHRLSMRMYLRDELVLMLERAGFTGVEVTGGYDGGPPTADHEFLVYAARAH